MTPSTSDAPSISTLWKLADERLKDARCLFRSKRYDAAAYLCGYALENALKACICKRLRVREYPQSKLQGRFKTHAFDELLLLAGLSEDLSPEKHLKNWSVVSNWEPGWRYRPPRSVKKEDADDMIRVLSREILPWLKSNP